MGEIEQVARHNLRGYCRVANERNDAGHHVVALIFEPQPR
jgi:hypothetical protein